MNNTKMTMFENQKEEEEEKDFTIQDFTIQEISKNNYKCITKQGVKQPMNKLFNWVEERFNDNNLRFFYSSDIKEKSGCKNFYYSSNIYDFITYYNTLENKHIYEIIKSTRPMKLYFDIDYEYKPTDCKDIFRPSDFYDVFSDFFDSFCGSELSNDYVNTNFFVTDSSTDKKVSLHIISNDIKFRNFEDLKIFMNKVRLYYEKNKHEYEEYLDSIDWSVYSKNRLMRLILSSKMNDNKRVLKVPMFHPYSYERKNQLQRFFITIIEDNNPFFDIPKPWRRLKQILTTRKQETIERVLYDTIYDLQETKPELLKCNDEIEYLLHLIPREHREEYGKWVNMIFLLKKLGVSNEKIHTWSSLSDKYQEDTTNNVINSFVLERCKGSINTLKTICGVYNITRYLSKFPVKSEILENLQDEDPYLFLDFFNDYSNFTFPSFKEFKDTIFPLLPKLFSFIHETNFFIVNISEDTWTYKNHNSIQFSTYYFNEEGEKEKYDIKTLYKDFPNIFPNYSKIVFKPMDYKLRKHEFNLWKGFKCKKVDLVDLDKIQPLLNHLLEVWSNDNEDYFKYILTWLRHILITPYNKTRIGLVIKGDQGSGKGVICEFLKNHIYGRINSCSTTGIDKITQKHNGIVQGKIFINVNELSACNDKYNAVFDRLKPLITDDTTLVELKGLESYEIENHANYLFTTNHDFTIKLEKNDRRYACFECNDKYMKDKDYFNNLISTLNQETANHFYTYLLTYDTGIDLRDIPLTELRSNMIDRSLNSAEYYLDCLFDEDRPDLREIELQKTKKGETYIKKETLFKYYISFCEMENISQKFNKNTFCGYANKRFVDDFRPIINGKKLRVYKINFNEYNDDEE